MMLHSLKFVAFKALRQKDEARRAGWLTTASLQETAGRRKQRSWAPVRSAPHFEIPQWHWKIFGEGGIRRETLDIKTRSRQQNVWRRRTCQGKLWLPGMCTNRALPWAVYSIGWVQFWRFVSDWNLEAMRSEWRESALVTAVGNIL